VNDLKGVEKGVEDEVEDDDINKRDGGIKTTLEWSFFSLSVISDVCEQRDSRIQNTRSQCPRGNRMNQTLGYRIASASTKISKLYGRDGKNATLDWITSAATYSVTTRPLLLIGTN
jgi:hypothetical protein